MINKNKNKIKYEILDSNDILTIQRMGIDAGLEPGDIGEVVKGWVAQVDRKIVGGIMLLKVDCDHTIEWLSVKEEYRGQGIGSALVRQAINFSKKKGGKRIIISIQIPNFFKKFGFVYSTSKGISPNFLCFRCKRFNKSCFPVIMVLDFMKRSKPITIELTKEIPLLEKFAQEKGQETSHEITKRVEKAWFAYKGGKVIGGIGIFKWDKDYTLDYYFAMEDKELIQENLMKRVLLYALKNKVNKIFLIRGAPDYDFFVERFGFRQIHWKDLPKIYRNFSLSMCDKCPKERSSICNPIAMRIDLEEARKYIYENNF